MPRPGIEPGLLEPQSNVLPLYYLSPLSFTLQITTPMKIKQFHIDLKCANNLMCLLLLFLFLLFFFNFLKLTKNYYYYYFYFKRIIYKQTNN